MGMRREDKLKRLIDHLRYDKREGKFYWETSLPRRVRGTLAGTVSKEGFMFISWEGTKFSYKHIVWFIHMGKLVEQYEGVLLTKGDKLDTRYSQLHLHTFEGRWGEERIKDTYRYHPETGKITLKKPIHGPMGEVGAVVGYKSNTGYMDMKIGSYSYRQHRVAWLLMTGKWPDHQIDHINGERDDNRWENLRDVTQVINSQNRRGSKGETKHFGVSKSNCGGYRARINVKGKTIHLGIYSTPQEAHLNYLKAKREHHEGNTI